MFNTFGAFTRSKKDYEDEEHMIHTIDLRTFPKNLVEWSIKYLIWLSSGKGLHAMAHECEQSHAMGQK